MLALRFEALPPERQGESAEEEEDEEEEEEEEEVGRGRGRRARDAPSRDTTRGFGVAAALLAAAAKGVVSEGESARFLAWELELEAAPGVAAEPRELLVFPPEDDENRARRRHRFSSSESI